MGHLLTINEPTWTYRHPESLVYIKFILCGVHSVGLGKYTVTWSNYYGIIVFVSWYHCLNYPLCPHRSPLATTDIFTDFI